MARSWHEKRVEPQLVDGLRERRAETKARWIALLNIEPVTTPLANPGTLAFMIDDSLDGVYSALAEPRAPRATKSAASSHSHNPFVAYFLAGKQALLEALVLVQAQGAGDRNHRDAAVAELGAAIEAVVGGEVDAFGQVCHAHHAAMARARSAQASGTVNEFAG